MNVDNLLLKSQAQALTTVNTNPATANKVLNFAQILSNDYSKCFPVNNS